MNNHQELTFIKSTIAVMLIIMSANYNHAQCPTNDPALDISNGIIPYTVHNVDEAWACTCGDEDVKVAMIDLYSAALHEEFQGKLLDFSGPLIPNLELLGCDHGLTTAGIVGALPNNNAGTAGIGYNTKLGLFSIADGCGIDSLVVFDAFQEAVSKGYKIINSTLIFDIENEEQETVLADYLSDGGLLVVAGGQNAHTQYADWPGVINVGGMVSGDVEGEFIYKNVYNQEEEVPFDIFVSLEDMEGLLAFDQWGFTANLLTENAAMVSATAALMLAVNDTLTGAEIEQIIKETGQGEVLNSPSNSVTTYLDIGAAVEGAKSFGVLDTTTDLDSPQPLIYPNPSSDFINIDFDIRDSKIRLTDASGKSVELFVEHGRVDISHLTPGLYQVSTLGEHYGAFLKIGG
jgi:hypothetical protein